MCPSEKRPRGPPSPLSTMRRDNEKGASAAQKTVLAGARPCWDHDLDCSPQNCEEGLLSTSRSVHGCLLLELKVTKTQSQATCKMTPGLMEAPGQVRFTWRELRGALVKVCLVPRIPPPLTHSRAGNYLGHSERA